MAREPGKQGTGEPRDRILELEEWVAVRVAALETQNRRLRYRTWLLSLGLLMALALGGMLYYLSYGVSLPGPVMFRPALEGTRFVLRDEEGRVRGTWGVMEDGATRLVMQDAQGVARLNVTVLASGSPGIAFSDQEGNRRVVLGLLPDETSTLVFADGNGQTRAVLGLSPDQSANLVFADQRGATRAAIGVGPQGEGNLILPDQSGSPPEN